MSFFFLKIHFVQDVFCSQVFKEISHNKIFKPFLILEWASFLILIVFSSSASFIFLFSFLNKIFVLPFTREKYTIFKVFQVFTWGFLEIERKIIGWPLKSNTIESRKHQQKVENDDGEQRIKFQLIYTFAIKITMVWNGI